MALRKALELGHGKKINIYTDTRYTFVTAHLHGVIFRERGLLTAEEKTIKSKRDSSSAKGHLAPKETGYRPLPRTPEWKQASAKGQ